MSCNFRSSKATTILDYSLTSTTATYIAHIIMLIAFATNTHLYVFLKLSFSINWMMILSMIVLIITAKKYVAIQTTMWNVGTNAISIATPSPPIAIIIFPIIPVAKFITTDTKIVFHQFFLAKYFTNPVSTSNPPMIKQQHIELAKQCLH